MEQISRLASIVWINFAGVLKASDVRMHASTYTLFSVYPMVMPELPRLRP